MSKSRKQTDIEPRIPNEIEIADTIAMLKRAGSPVMAEVVRGLAFQRDLLAHSLPHLLAWSELCEDPRDTHIMAKAIREVAVLAKVQMRL